MKKQEVGKTQFCYNHLYCDHLTVVPKCDRGIHEGVLRSYYHFTAGVQYSEERCLAESRAPDKLL